MATTAPMKKKAAETEENGGKLARTFNVHAVSPGDPRLVVVGRDRTDIYKEDHPLYQKGRALLGPAVRRHLRHLIKTYGYRKGKEVIVRKDGEFLLVVAGRNRVMACRELALGYTDEENVEHAPDMPDLNIPVVVESGSDQEMVALRAVDNYSYIKPDAMTTAEDVHELVKQRAPVKDICAIFGFASKASIDRYELIYGNLVPALQDFVRDGSLPVKTAAAIASKYRRDEQIVKYNEHVDAGTLTAEAIGFADDGGEASAEASTEDPGEGVEETAEGEETEGEAEPKKKAKKKAEATTRQTSAKPSAAIIRRTVRMFEKEMERIREEKIPRDKQQLPKFFLDYTPQAKEAFLDALRIACGGKSPKALPGLSTAFKAVQPKPRHVTTAKKVVVVTARKAAE
jgi:ParB-like chromosome segregation protein Spo0J